MDLRIYRTAVPVVAVMIVYGCGSGRESASLTGRVESNGEPVAGVLVRFQPVGDGKTVEATMGSFGETDEEGQFTLRFSDDESMGVALGEHVVVIDELTPEDEEEQDAGGDGDDESSRIPPEWQNGSQKFTVEPGDNEVTFDLKAE